jgi:hypothetical protein
MDRFEFVSATASTRDAATGDSKPNYQGTDFTRRQFGTGAFAPLPSCSFERNNRAFWRAAVFSGRVRLAALRLASTAFCKFFCFAASLTSAGLNRLPHCGAGFLVGSEISSTMFLEKTYFLQGIQPADG